MVARAVDPGPSDSAYIIYNKYSEILKSGGSYIGITTNNLAEYTGVLLGLRAAQQFAGPSDGSSILTAIAYW